MSNAIDLLVGGAAARYLWKEFTPLDPMETYHEMTRELLNRPSSSGGTTAGVIEQNKLLKRLCESLEQERAEIHQQQAKVHQQEQERHEFNLQCGRIATLLRQLDQLPK